MRKFKDHSSILLGFLFGLSVICAASVSILGHALADVTQFIQIGHARIPFNSIQGTLQTLALMLCIIMGCVDCVVGARMAYFVVGYMEISSILSMIVTRNLSPLPGVCNGFLAIVAIILIGHLMRKAKKKAITDYATGTYNTIGFLEVLGKQIGKNKKVNLVYYQINNFRAINDDYGHDVGDRVLKIVSKRMLKTVGKQGFVGRIGGSEFALLLKEGVNAEELINEMFKSLKEKLVIDFGDTHLDCYIDSRAGIAAFPKDADNANDLFKCADIALMHAMKDARKSICTFDEEMLSKMLYDKEIEQLVKKAHDENYFYVEYQPQYLIKDQSLRGFESLIRMKLPDGRKISPGDFIPVAEKSNLIFTIDEFILKYVTKEFSDIVKEGDKDIVVSVNISANGFARPEFVKIVEEILKENDFPAKNLEIEITEYSFEESQEQTVNNVLKLKEAGIKVALDDFGTGYASLSRLMNLSVDLLKVDKSLVDNIEKGEVNRDFINSIGTMGHLLGCKVILEGVETTSQIEYIKKIDCDYIQGFVWGKPMGFDNACKLIKGE